MRGGGVDVQQVSRSTTVSRREHPARRRLARSVKLKPRDRASLSRRVSPFLDAARGSGVTNPQTGRDFPRRECASLPAGSLPPPTGDDRAII